MRVVHLLKSKGANNRRLGQSGNLDCSSHRRRRQANTARGQRASALRAGQRAQQLSRRGLWPIPLPEHCLAAAHVRHAAHAALVFTKTERHPGKRTTEKHEQKEQRCEPLFQLQVTLFETTNCRQPFNCAGIDPRPNSSIHNSFGKHHARSFSRLFSATNKVNLRKFPQSLLIFLFQSDSRRNLSAFPITDTELKLIAAAAIMGFSKSPRNGFSTPAAIGTPKTL